MRSITPPASARRTIRAAERRSRRRPAIIAAGLAFGLVAAAGASVTLPTSQAQASDSPAFALASYSVTALPVVADAAAKTTSATSDALAAAEQTVTAAATVSSDVAASGLPVAAPATTVDTGELEAAAARLDGADKLPTALVDVLIDDVTTLVASVDSDVSGLRGSLDAAIALKAEQEAAAQAQREAEAAAAAAAAAAKTTTSTTASGSSSPRLAGPGTSAGEAQAIAHSMLGGYGWGEDQFGCLVSLWDRESGWNSQAYNSSSGAYGIPQALPGSKMASAGADWQTNAATQIAWGFGYIGGRYGNPCGAWAHSQSSGWY